MANTYEFEINMKFYPQDAVYTTAYLLLDKYFIKLKSGKKNTIILQLTSQEKLQKKELEDIMRRIEQELINQTLRLRIAKENKNLREYILGKALLGAQFGVVQDTIPEGSDEADYIEDPLGIATPWEEKNKKSSEKKSTRKTKKTVKGSKKG
jgi:His-Xaa-Ser system protein HxsD